MNPDENQTPAPAPEEATPAPAPVEDKKYIGTKPIMMVEELSEIKTYLGNKMVKIHFEDGTNNILPEKVFATAVTTAPIDATALQDKICMPVAQEILAILTEASLTITNAGHTIDLVVNSLQHNTTEAAKRLFNVDHLENRTLMSFENILKGNAPTNY